jgi:hypothetical protein
MPPSRGAAALRIAALPPAIRAERIKMRLQLFMDLIRDTVLNKGKIHLKVYSYPAFAKEPQALSKEGSILATNTRVCMIDSLRETIAIV